MIQAVLVAVLLFLPAAGWAHGTGSRVTNHRAVVLDLHYSDGEAMSYADVQVFAPAETVAFLHGRADRLGRAAFVPDRNGEWRVEGRDAEGHLVRAVVPVSGGTAPTQVGGVPAWMLWVSLALNLFGLAQGIMTPRRRDPVSCQAPGAPHPDALAEHAPDPARRWPATTAAPR